MTEITKNAEKKSLKLERDILVAAKIRAQNAVNADASVSSLGALEKSTKMLIDYDTRMAPAAEPSFQNRKEALAWLQRQGYKIKKSKLYQDCKRGSLKIQNDESVTEADLKKYIRKVGLHRLAETPLANPNDLQEQKAKAEISKLQTQNKLLQRALDEKNKKYILRSDFEMEFAAKVAILKSGMEYMIYSYGYEWSELVLNAEKTAAPQRLIDNMKAIMVKQFNDFADIKKFEVVFTKEELIPEKTEGVHANAD